MLVGCLPIAIQVLPDAEISFCRLNRTVTEAQLDLLQRPVPAMCELRKSAPEIVRRHR